MVVYYVYYTILSISKHKEKFMMELAHNHLMSLLEIIFSLSVYNTVITSDVTALSHGPLTVFSLTTRNLWTAAPFL